MKYLLQQMLAFWAIILTIMIVVGLSFNSLTRQTMLENYYTQMFSYAKSIDTNTTDDLSQMINQIEYSDRFLENQQVEMVYFNPEGKPIFPINIQYMEDVYELISKSDWKSIKDGKDLSITVTCDSWIEEQEYALVVHPFYSNEHEFMGALALLHPVSSINSTIKLLIKNLLTAFLISSLIALVFSYVFAQFLVNRINRIKRAAREIANGNFDVKIKVNSADELGELAEDFNKMAQTLKESDEEIKLQEERRRRFMADAAHEMRTPLTTINGLLEGIAYKAIPKDQEEKSIELMRKETNRLIRLVNENLDYEKIRTNQIQMVKQTFNATETIKGIMTQLTKKAEESGNTLRIETNEEVDIYADYDRFIQIFFNIIQNAIQFTTNGEIVINVYNEAGVTVVSVCDTGIGMSENDVKNIWERYYKVDPSRKNTKYGESGLGLPIVQQLVKLHNGTISVESKINKGTRFTVKFPSLGKLTDKKTLK